MLASWCLLVLFSSTRALSPNASNPLHKATCRGGKVAACHCMLSCEVFGGQENAVQCGELPPEADHTWKQLIGLSGRKEYATKAADLESTVEVVNNAIQKALNSRGPDGTMTECDGIKCIVRCAKRQGCLSHVIKGKCLTIKRDDSTCNVDCNSSQHIMGTPGLQRILVAVLLIAVRLRH